MIVDDHEVFRDGLACLLQPEGFQTTAKYGDGVDAVRRLKDGGGPAFDVVLLDVRLPKLDGLSALEEIRSFDRETAIVMLSAHENITYVARAVALGASDFIDKSTDVSGLTRSLRLAASRSGCPEQSRMHDVRLKMTSEVPPASLPPDMPLTPREAQVLRHMGLGLSNREIAASLQISVETVKEHVQNVLRKLKANDRTDAAVRAVRAGIA